MQFSSTAKILLIFLLLKICMVEARSKNVVKLDSRMKLVSRFEKTKSVRRYIVKCCGKYSCREGKKRNSSQETLQNNLDLNKSILGSGSGKYDKNSNSKIDQAEKSGQNNGNAVGGEQIISNEGQGNSLTTSSNDANANAADQTNVQDMSQNANSDGNIDPIASGTLGQNSGDAGSGTNNPNDQLSPLPIGGAGSSFEISTADPKIAGSDSNGLNNSSLPSSGNGSKYLTTTNGPGGQSSQPKNVQQTTFLPTLQTNLSTRTSSLVNSNANNYSGSTTYNVPPVVSGIIESTANTGETISNGGTETSVETTEAEIIQVEETTIPTTVETEEPTYAVTEEVLPDIETNLNDSESMAQDFIKCARYTEADIEYDKYVEAIELARARNDTLTTTTKAPGTAGTFIPACGRVYIFGKDKYNVYQASKACMNRGMALLALETLDEKNCLLSIASKVIPMATKYWTTISNEGDDLNTYRQCSSNFSQSFPGEFKKPEHWSSTSVTDPNKQRCLGFKFNTTVNGTKGFFHDYCKFRTMSYICEPIGQNSTCPSQCKANPALLESDGKLKNATSYGYWTESCGKKYLFGNKLLNWDENWDMCCSLGMQPVVIESEEEQKCLSNLTATNWKYNFNYWTGGTQRGCFGQWRWCGSGSSVIKSEIRWAPGQPDNLKGNQSCLHMQIFRGGTLGLRLTDRNCTDDYVFACQGFPKMDLPCVEPECPDGKCTRNATLFTGIYLKNYDNYGIWVTGCNRHFLFSYAKASWKIARDNCCQFGMTVVSVESISKHQCLVGAITQNNKTYGFKYWTSGTDTQCPGKYHWCSNDFPFRQEQVNWESGSPKAAGGCVYMKPSGNVNRTVYGTTDCGDLMQYVCEVRKQATAPTALVEECESMHYPAIDEEEDIPSFPANFSYSTQNIKCFTKCVGEQKKLFFNNAVRPVPTIRLVETLTQNNIEEMQKGFQTYKFCTKIKRENECDTAADIFSCSYENSGSLVSKMLDADRLNTTIYYPPVPCNIVKRKCLNAGLTCAINTVRRNDLMTKRKNDVGKLINLKTSLRDVFWAYQNYTVGMDYKYAYQYCCSLGMDLWRPKNPAEMRELTVALGLTATYSVIGFTRFFNATHEVWCDSGTLVTIADVFPLGGFPGYKCQDTVLVGFIAIYSTSSIRIRPLASTFNSFTCQPR